MKLLYFFKIVQSVFIVNSSIVQVENNEVGGILTWFGIKLKQLVMGILLIT